jgi:hypothetical protein
MGKAYKPEELASKIFYVSMAGVLAFIAMVFVFVL